MGDSWDIQRKLEDKLQRIDISGTIIDNGKLLYIMIIMGYTMEIHGIVWIDSRTPVLFGFCLKMVYTPQMATFIGTVMIKQLI